MDGTNAQGKANKHKLQANLGFLMCLYHSPMVYLGISISTPRCDSTSDAPGCAELVPRNPAGPFSVHAQLRFGLPNGLTKTFLVGSKVTTGNIPSFFCWKVFFWGQNHL